MSGASPGALPRRAMVLAAGRGERLRPITDRTPKPLVRIAGRTMLDRTLESLRAAGVAECVVNVHHLAGRIVSHLARRDRPRIILSREATLLETGGGIAHALPHFAGEPFCVANSDVVILDGVEPAWRRLGRAWDAAAMDALLLLAPAAASVGYEGRGDFQFDRAGVPRRRRDREIASFVYAGWQIVHPRLFESCPAGPFSLNRLFDRALRTGRLAAITHDGAWFHVGTPQGLRAVERAIGWLR